MLDAGRNRVLREFICVTNRRQDDARHRAGPDRRTREIGKDLVTDALAVIAVRRERLAMLRRFVPMILVAIAENLARVTRQHEQGDDGNQQVGAEKMHGLCGK